MEVKGLSLRTPFGYATVMSKAPEFCSSCLPSGIDCLLLYNKGAPRRVGGGEGVRLMSLVDFKNYQCCMSL